MSNLQHVPCPAQATTYEYMKLCGPLITELNDEGIGKEMLVLPTTDD